MKNQRTGDHEGTVTQAELFQLPDEFERLKLTFIADDEGNLERRFKSGKRRKTGSLTGRQGYLATRFEGNLVYNHRIGLELRTGIRIPPGIEVDHINGNPQDNRPENLRTVTRSENQRNRVRSRNNITGVTGVHWEKNIGKWKVYIRLGQKYLHLGYFDKKQKSAAIAVRKVAEHAFGFHQNHGRPGPGVANTETPMQPPPVELPAPYPARRKRTLAECFPVSTQHARE